MTFLSWGCGPPQEDAAHRQLIKALYESIVCTYVYKPDPSEAMLQTRGNAAQRRTCDDDESSPAPDSRRRRGQFHLWRQVRFASGRAPATAWADGLLKGGQAVLAASRECVYLHWRPSRLLGLRPFICTTSTSSQGSYCFVSRYNSTPTLYKKKRPLLRSSASRYGLACSPIEWATLMKNNS
jgi:hypothetical protein